MQHAQGFLDAVNAAKKQIRECTVDDVTAMRQRGDAFHLVDVREDDEFRAGHAAGAVHIGKGLVERDIEGKIPDKDATIVLYCGGGFRSALAGLAIQEMGYRNVISMDGGIKAWRDTGLPTETP